MLIHEATHLFGAIDSTIMTAVGFEANDLSEKAVKGLKVAAG